MSRIVWGTGKANKSNDKNGNENKKQQQTLDGFVKIAPSRRQREDEINSMMMNNSNTISTTSTSDADAIRQSVINSEDGVQWGPSGGSNRETQRRRQPQRPWMFGKERSAAFDKSSYSRDFIKEWQNVRVEQEDEWNRSHSNNNNTTRVKKEEANNSNNNSSVKKEEADDSSSSLILPSSNDNNNNNNKQTTTRRVFMSASAKGTTEMDPTLITARFIKNPDCPRNLFSGKCFFLNSCDADPVVSVYQLEKIIRFLGGVTAMGVSSRVDYILTQHLSSAKEAKLLKDFDEVRDLDTNGTKKKSSSSSTVTMKTVTNGGAASSSNKSSLPKCVHPHFVLDCCEAGRIVPLEKYLTTPKCANVVSTVVDVDDADRDREKKKKKNISNKTQQEVEVIELD